MIKNTIFSLVPYFLAKMHGGEHDKNIKNFSVLGLFFNFQKNSLIAIFGKIAISKQIHIKN
jgi:hypothetical protein